MSLDNLVDKTKLHEMDVIPLLEFDQYVGKFQEKYEHELDFQDKIHKYLGLNIFDRFGLGFSRIFRPKAYEETTFEFVLQYSKEVYNDTKTLNEAILAAQNAHVLEAEANEKKIAFDKAYEEAKEAESAYTEVKTEQDTKVSSVEMSYEEQMAQAQREYEASVSQIEEKYDVEEIVKQTVTKNLEKSGYFVVSDSGFAYNDEAIIKTVEDALCNETLQEINGHSSTNSGFYARLQQAIDGLITHYDDIEDPSEIDDVDWTETFLNARAQGYSIPQYRHFVVGKRSPEKARMSFDNAIAIDASTSMNHNKRWPAAKKMGLAVSSLMRRLNKDNETYLATFGNYLNPTTSAELYKQTRPDGWTKMAKALDWIGESLADSAFGMAHIISDGGPTDLDYTMPAAERLSQYDNIITRIYVIDGDDDTRAIMSDVGKAIGPLTRIVDIDSHKLASSAFSEIETAIGQFKDLATY